MRRRNTIRIAMLALILVGAFLIINSAASAGKSKPGKESMEQCCKKKAGSSGKTVLESLSQHFFSSI